MADQVYAADVLYPEYRDGDDVKRYVQQVSDYLFLLREGLGYTLDNLSMRNFNQTALVQMADMIREPVMIQLTDQAGRLTQLSVDLDGVAARVTDTEGGISELRIEAGRISSEVSDLSGNYTTLSQTVGGLSTSVTTINNNYISRSSATQTASGFVLEVKDANNTTATKMDSDGLTVYNGNITIENNDGDKVLTADTNGNLVLSGTITGSYIYGSELITCSASDVSTAPHFRIGVYNNVPIIQSMNGTTGNGFRAVGDATKPSYGLLIGGTAELRTQYGQVVIGGETKDLFQMRVVGGNAFFGQTADQAGIAYYDATVPVEHSINVKSDGIRMRGNVYINGTLLPY